MFGFKFALSSPPLICRLRLRLLPLRAAICNLQSAVPLRLWVVDCGLSLQ
jgi:hypothetical protein